MWSLLKNKSILRPNPLIKQISVLSNTEKRPGKVVLISQSTDVYSNLALEDWLYKNWAFDKRFVLFLWRNSPCVVIGRHQNPYVEANLRYLQSAKVPVVRRNSGGGTVYHDEGNLNCTFFTPRSRHNRHWNLNLICEAIFKDFGIKASLNHRDDLIVENDLKISGTAAKLGRLSAYHHCTVLVSANESQLSLALKGEKSVNSKATPSIPAAIVNLQKIHPTLTVEQLLSSIGKHYLEKSITNEADVSSSENYRQSDGFTLVNPTEDWFPGLDEMKSNLKSWEWFHGMTPLFSVTRPLLIPSSPDEKSSNEVPPVEVTLEAYHGIIKRVVIGDPTHPLKELFVKEVESVFVGLPYSEETFTDIEHKLSECFYNSMNIFSTA